MMRLWYWIHWRLFPKGYTVGVDYAGNRTDEYNVVQLWKKVGNSLYLVDHVQWRNK